MSAPILATKLYFPPPRPDIVPRPHLLARLNAGLPGRLTLISAPAGFGKTTLAGEWLAARPAGAAWLSLDREDGDLARFVAYVVAALRTAVGDKASGPGSAVGERTLGMLQSSPPPPAAAILTPLLNEIAARPDRLVLVLDDYHEIEARPVDEALTFLLEHQPPQLHLVITTREDPNLPLARLRAHGQLTELRAADLRFTPEEAAAFLNNVMGLELSAGEIAALETRTEGWIAGLQLAALSMQGRDDAPRFISAFAGDNRYIVDYLVEEVLQRQPERIRRFLLQTAILERLCGPLCDAVTGQAGSDALLAELERANLFVVSLDDRRRWYRYHQLFADVLQVYALKEQPEEIHALHRRASGWCARNGLPAEAIHHALAAGDFEPAAELVELAWPEMDRNRRSATWLGWVKALPEAQVRARPVLSAGYGWALLNAGELEAGAARLRDAEWQLAADSPAIIVAAAEEFRFLPATIASGRAYGALALGDLAATERYARQALDLLPEAARLRRGIPASLLSLVAWTGGDLEAAGRAMAEAMAAFQLAGNVLFAITGTYVLAGIRVAQGRLREAFAVYHRSLRLAEEAGESVLWGTADLHTGLAELHHERNELAAAAEQLRRSRELGERAGLPHWPYRWRVAQARLRQAEGDLNGALELLDEAERRYVRGPVPDVRPIAAWKPRLWVAQGRLAAALDWARAQGLSAGDAPDYRREFEHLSLARALIAAHRERRAGDAGQEAAALLGRLLAAAEAGGRMGSVIEILMLQALVHEAQERLTAALGPLARALALAEPEGYGRLFLDEGAPMARLLATAAAQGTAPEYTARLLAAFSAGEPPGAAPSPPPQPLVEPLSDRELEVLRLVADGLSNREIGERLFLALSTVKGHNRNIYSKLQVQRRTEAVARARELGLL